MVSDIPAGHGGIVNFLQCTLYCCVQETITETGYSQLGQMRQPGLAAA